MKFHVCAFLAITACTANPVVGEYESVLHEEVLTVDYETPEFRITAHRFSRKTPFTVTVQTRDGGYRHCMSDDVFDKSLEPFELLRSVRHIGSQEFARLTKGKAYHRLRTTTTPPMEAFERVLSPLPNGHLAVPDNDAGYELGLTTQHVEKLGQSCGGVRAHTRVL